MEQRRKILIHATHEAARKIGGIGAVLDGMLTSEAYKEAVSKSILVAPLFYPEQSAEERLGSDGAILYSSLDGLTPTKYAKKFGKIERDFGDIDVLAWRPDREEVLIIECKDLSLARNYSEIAALLSDYQGVELEGEADKLRKHLNRVALLQDNRDQLQRFTGLQEPRLVSCLVCSGVVPMQYAKIDALANTHVGGIPDILGF